MWSIVKYSLGLLQGSIICLFLAKIQHGYLVCIHESDSLWLQTEHVQIFPHLPTVEVDKKRRGGLSTVVRWKKMLPLVAVTCPYSDEQPTGK